MTLALRRLAFVRQIGSKKSEITLRSANCAIARFRVQRQPACLLADSGDLRSALWR